MFYVFWFFFDFLLYVWKFCRNVCKHSAKPMRSDWLRSEFHGSCHSDVRIERIQRPPNLSTPHAPSHRLSPTTGKHNCADGDHRRRSPGNRRRRAAPTVTLGVTPSATLLAGTVETPSAQFHHRHRSMNRRGFLAVDITWPSARLR
jgi:hypothetical protein